MKDMKQNSSMTIGNLDLLSEMEMLNVYGGDPGAGDNFSCLHNGSCGNNIYECKYNGTCYNNNTCNYNEICNGNCTGGGGGGGGITENPKEENENC